MKGHFTKKCYWKNLGKPTKKISNELLSQKQVDVQHKISDLLNIS